MTKIKDLPMNERSRVKRYNFDEQINNRYPVNDYNSDNYLGFIRKCKISDKYEAKEVILNLGMADLIDGDFVLNNTGILFLGNNPERYLLHSVVTCTLYKGKEKVTILDRKDFNSDIISNIENALIFLKRHLNLRYEITGLRRKEILQLPETALREAIVNAVTHRDYFERGANVLVELFSDRLEITNPGGLPAGMEVSDLGKKSITRNPLIAAMLLRADYIEKLGTGIKRIKKALKEGGHYPVIFEIDRFFTIIFRLKYKYSVEKGNDEPLNEPLNEPLKVLLKELELDPSASKEKLAEKIGVSRATITRHIKKLKELKLIKRIGSDKTGYWEVVYD